MEKNDEPPVGLDMMGEPIIDPAPDKPPTWEDSPAGKALFKGGSCGMIVGLAIATSYYDHTSWRSISLLGLFSGDVAFFAVGLGFILGALLGWSSVKVTGKDQVPPTPPSILGRHSSTEMGPTSVPKRPATPMNPLGWKRERFVAWIVFCFVGGMIGLLFAWFKDPFYQICMAGIAKEWANCTLVFLEWLPYPSVYWPKVAFGVLIPGITFYAVQLFRTSD